MHDCNLRARGCLPVELQILVDVKFYFHQEILCVSRDSTI